MNQFCFEQLCYAFIELFKHSPRIHEKSKLQQDELLDLLRILLDLIDLVDEAVVSLGSWVEASRLCSDVDPDDTPLVALALQMPGKLWTNDEPLRTHLIRMGFSNFFNTSKTTFLN